jgi:Ca-activated chloride channel family protein
MSNPRYSSDPRKAPPSAAPRRMPRFLVPALAFLTLLLTGAATLAFCSADRKGILPSEETAVLQGTITDAASGEALPFATVVLENSAYGANTDFDGRFRIEGIVPGRYTVQVRYVSYMSFEKEVVFAAGETVKLDVAMNAEAAVIDEVVIIENEVLMDRAAISTQNVTVAGARRVPKRELRRMAAVAGGKGLANAESAGVYVEPLPPGAPSPDDPGRVDSDFNTEDYDRIFENPFRKVIGNPLSTFSIDVDAASYANVRRYVDYGQAPPADAVRIEELVNYFDYDYPQPEDEHPFALITEMSDNPWNDSTKLVHIGLQGQSVDLENLAPSNLVFLIDVSGSMNQPSKLGLVQSSLGKLVDQLGPEDRVAIVVYAGAAGLVLPSTPGNRKADIQRAIQALRAGGSTAGGAGIRLAYDVAQRHLIKEGNNRVILCTDGDFNVGASSDAEMIRLIEEKRKSGIYITVCGFGMGNYKDNKMEKIADHGNGNYFYIDQEKEAHKVFVTDMRATLFTIAQDVKLQIEFNPTLVASYRLIGYENRMLAKEDFDDDQKDAGELGAGHTVTALYEVHLTEAGRLRANGKDGRPENPRKGRHNAMEDHSEDLRYQENQVRPEAYTSSELLHLKLR